MKQKLNSFQYSMVKGLTLAVTFITLLTLSMSVNMPIANARSLAGNLTGITKISAGSFHTCTLTNSGGVKCWGFNNNGQLGDGTTITSTIPVNVIGLTSGVTNIAVGVGHSCALTSSGGVKCWGLNDSGQLGDGTTTDRYTPVDVTGLTSSVIAIAAAGWHSCALTNTGGVKCWGYNLYSQLGEGGTTDRYTPVDVTGLTSEVIAITTGNWHTCALTNGGGVKCWGLNNKGQLGDNTTTNRVTAINVTGLTNGITAISAGYRYTCALVGSGEVTCWGDNLGGQLGDGTTTDRYTPVNVSGLTSVITNISAGNYHICALISSGGMKCWGSNRYGQLGNGTTTNSSTPVDVSGLTSGVALMESGGWHTCAVISSGEMKCWGSNSEGELGDGTMTDHFTPVNVIDGLLSTPTSTSTPNMATSTSTTISTPTGTPGTPNGTPTATPTGTPNGTPTATPTDRPAINCNASDTATLTACIKDAVNGDTITFISNITLNSELPVISKNLKFEGNAFTISGNSTYRVFSVKDSTVTFQNMTIANGQAKGGHGGDGGGSGGGGAGLGGGLFNSNGIVTIRNVIFSVNQAIGGSGSRLSSWSLAGTGGGGGGSIVSRGDNGTNGSGGHGYGTGGNGGDVFNDGTGGSGYNGGFGGGGGGGATARNSGSSWQGVGGNGGYGGFGGGGGGGGRGRTGGYGTAGGYGGGNGGNGGLNDGDGGGGLGAGGAIFAMKGTITLIDVSFNGNSVTVGTGASNGQALGKDIFICTTQSSLCTGTVVNKCGTTNPTDVVGTLGTDCSAMATATPTNTPIPTATDTPTPTATNVPGVATNTPVPTVTGIPMSRLIYLPLVLK